MTVTIVYGSTGDGYAYSQDATYSNVRNGAGLQAFASNPVGYAGQSKYTQYASTQTFFRFAYTAVPATEVVTSATICLTVSQVFGPAIARDLEVRAYNWSAGGVTTADWQNPTALASRVLFATYANVNTVSAGQRIRAGSDLLIYHTSVSTGMEFMLVTNRQRLGTVPTADEMVVVNLAGTAGTATDPALVYTTAPRSRVFGALGASAQLADGTWAYIENNGAGYDLKHVTQAGTVTTIGALPIGTTAATFADPAGAQGLALVTDPDANLYVFGRLGSAPGSIACRAYAKAAGYAWTAGTLRAFAMPSHSAQINNVTAAWVGQTGGVIFVLCAHGAGTLVPSGTTDTAWATVSRDSLLSGAGALPLAVGDASAIMELDTLPDEAGGHRNEVGSGLDVAVSADVPGWTYASSWARKRVPGQNGYTALARYLISGIGTGSPQQSQEPSVGWGVKDASGKLRVIEATGGLAMVVSADRDTGFGISAYIQMHTADLSGSTSVGRVYLAGESIPSMPDGPAVASSQAWDAAFSPTENRVWVYYVDVTNSLRVRRTPISLDTFTATRQEVTVYTAPAGSTIQAIRLPRGGRVSARALVQVAYVNGGVNSLANVVDQYNVAPTAPTLTPRSGVDATLAFSLTWTFTDPNAGDTQSAYQLQIEDTAAPGVAVVDTGKVVSASMARTITAGTLANSKTYQWRVRTYDALDVAGPYSGYSSFTTAAGGAVTITSPAADNPPGIATDEYQITWSAAGTVQAGYRIWLYRAGAMISDSGWIASAAQTHLITGMLSDVENEVRVQVRNSALVTSNIGTRLITPSYGTPERPAITVTPVPDGGYMEIAVSNPAPGQPAGGGPEYGFEPGDSLAGFTDSAGTLALSTDRALRGTGSGKFTATGGVQAYSRAPAQPVTTGQRYTVRFWAYSTAGRNITASIDWLGPAAAYLSTGSAQIAVPAGVWTLCRFTGSAPAGVETARYGPTLNTPNPSAGEIIYIDDLLISPASDRPETIFNEIYRRPVGESTWALIGTCEPDSVYRDYSATSGVAYEYMARGIG